jgi:hypothetical protein
LQRIKLNNNSNNNNNNNNNNSNESSNQQEKVANVSQVSRQPPELPPPRISDKNFKMPSVDTYVDSASKRTDESFADFTQFPDGNVS